MKHDFQRKIDTERQMLDRLNAAAERRSHESQRRLDSESIHHKYFGTSHSFPLATKEKYSGNYEEGLTHLVLVGGMMLGISRGVNNKLKGTDRNPVDMIRVSVLPVGDHAAAAKHSAVTLLEVNPAQLNRPRQDGTIQNWEEIVIGRNMLAEATGTVDPTVSGSHAKITITAEGALHIEDHSTNGTQILNELDLQNLPGHGGLDDSGKQELADMMQRFQENPWEWTKDSADVTVIVGN